MASLIRSIGLAALLCTGTAYAQQDNPDNPHSTKSKDRQGTNTPSSVSNEQTQGAESANPHAVNNKDDASKPQGSANMDAMQTQNPEDPQYRNREKTDPNGMSAGHDHDMMMKNATPQMVLQHLHMANLEEINMGKMAEKNGTDKVKTFAKTLEQDHQAADRQVQDLAKKKGWTVSDTPKDPKMQEKKQSMQDRLSGMNGADFDRGFANMMVNGHRHVIAMTQNFRQNCKDQDVCNLIDQLTPKLQQHLQTAEQLRGPAAQGRAPDNR
jgi:predicted outer membrane protein